MPWAPIGRTPNLLYTTQIVLLKFSVVEKKLSVNSRPATQPTFSSTCLHDSITVVKVHSIEQVNLIVRKRLGMRSYSIHSEMARIYSEKFKRSLVIAYVQVSAARIDKALTYKATSAASPYLSYVMSRGSTSTTHHIPTQIALH